MGAGTTGKDWSIRGSMCASPRPRWRDRRSARPCSCFPCRNGIGWFERERITDVGVCLPRHSKSAIASNPDANKQRRPANSAIPVFVNVVEYIKDQTTSKVTSSKEAKGNIWDKTYCGQCPLACLSSLPIKINLVSVLF